MQITGHHIPTGYTNQAPGLCTGRSVSGRWGWQQWEKRRGGVNRCMITPDRSCRQLLRVCRYGNAQAAAARRGGWSASPLRLACDCECSVQDLRAHDLGEWGSCICAARSSLRGGLYLCRGLGIELRNLSFWWFVSCPPVTQGLVYIVLDWASPNGHGEFCQRDAWSPPPLAPGTWNGDPNQTTSKLTSLSLLWHVWGGEGEAGACMAHRHAPLAENNQFLLSEIIRFPPISSSAQLWGTPAFKDPRGAK